MLKVIMDYSIPATDKYLKSLYKSILSPIFEQYDVHLKGVEGLGKSGLTKFLTFRQAADRYRKDYKDLQLLYIDKINTTDEISAWIQLAQQLDIEQSEQMDILIPKIVSYLDKLTRKDNKTVAIFLNQVFEWKFLNKECIDRLLNLKKVYEEKVKFILISDGLTSSEVYDYVPDLSTFKIKEVWMPTYSLEDTKHQIKRNKSLANQDIPSKNIDEIAEKIHNLSGGIGSLTKQLSLMPIKELSKSAKELLDNKNIFNQLLQILRRIDSKYIKLLKNRKHDSELQKAGLINNDGQINSELIETFLELHNPAEIPSITTDLGDKLSPQELEVFQLLSDNANQTVTREDIAKVLWKDDYLEKYSDWAIDSVLSRIRKKLPEKTINTVKGKGFYLKK